MAEAWLFLPGNQIGVETAIAYSSVYVFHLEPSLLLWFMIGLAAVSLFAVVAYFALASAKNRKDAANRERIGKYALIKALGQGGTADVYLAKHRESREQLAIKLLRNPTNVAVLRFQREVQVLRGLSNPHTVQLLDSGVAADGSHYYAMEYLDGFNLLELVSQFGPMSDGRAKYLMIQVCIALQAIHNARLVHRDVNPANIIVSGNRGHGNNLHSDNFSSRSKHPESIHSDFATLVDFGLVLNCNEGEPHLDGSVAGTPAFISPEAAAGKSTLDPRSDVYSLGCVAYFLVTGSPPFVGSTPIEICWKHLNELPIDISEAAKQPISKQFSQLVRRSLQKAAGDRQQSVTQLLQELEECETQKEWSSTEADDWWDQNNDTRI